MRILFFRLGDFYEMFFDDAKLASRELELTLTGQGLRPAGARADVRRAVSRGRNVYRPADRQRATRWPSASR